MRSFNCKSLKILILFLNKFLIIKRIFKIKSYEIYNIFNNFLFLIFISYFLFLRIHRAYMKTAVQEKRFANARSDYIIHDYYRATSRFHLFLCFVSFVNLFSLADDLSLSFAIVYLLRVFFVKSVFLQKSL